MDWQNDDFETLLRKFHLREARPLAPAEPVGIRRYRLRIAAAAAVLLALGASAAIVRQRSARNVAPAIVEAQPVAVETPAAVATTAVAPPLPPVPAPAVEPAPKPIRARAALGMVGGIGSAPVRNLGVTVSVGARRVDLSIDVEGRADLPASVPLEVGKVSTSLLVASLVPCIHWRVVAGCGLVTGGALRAAGHGLVDSRQVSDPYVALGARVALEVPVSGKLNLIAHADASAPLITTELRVGGEELWTTPPVSFLVGLGVGLAFP